MDHRHYLETLLESGRIDLRRGALLDSDPGPLPQDFSFDRCEGMLLGLAIGDALGNTSESQNPDERRERYGEIRDYLPNSHVGGRAVGLPSDDTQLAFWTVEQLLADGELIPERVAARFCREPIYGIGSAVTEFLANFKAGRPWDQCGARSSGNGALMRIAPAVLPYLRQPGPGLWASTALLAMITHNDAASTSACMAFVRIFWELLGRERPPEPEWWVERYVAAARDLEGDTTYQLRGGPLLGYQGSLWNWVAEQVPQAYRDGLTVVEAAQRWRSGAYLMETVPCVLYILMRYAHDPEAAVIRAVNDTRDNDSIAAIVGAAVGALHGRAGWPARWVDSLLGRTGAADDGRVFELIRLARERWG